MILLTDSLIDSLHEFQVTGLSGGLVHYQSAFPEANGQSFGTGYALYTGHGSPLTQAFGIGHRDSDFDLDALEEWYTARTQNWELTITPFTNPKLAVEACQRGYVIDHFETVLCQELGNIHLNCPPHLRVEEVTGQLDVWMRVSEAGWTGTDELPETPSDIARLMNADSSIRRYLGYVDAEPAGAASLVSRHGMFALAGACTLPKFRGRGLQQALTNQRLFDAGDGSLVFFEALPGSTSHRNAQRNGFMPLYSKVVMFRHSNTV